MTKREMRSDSAAPRGLFISFEGIDGSGKSTLLERLAEGLRRGGRSVRVLREPGGTGLGDALRELLLQRELAGFCPESELMLFCAARAQLVREVIKPALRAGELVLCDRFLDSTLAYQAYGRGLPLDKVAALLDWATDGLRPELTVLVDLPVEVASSRIRGRARGDGDRIEAAGEAFMRRVRAGFLELAAREPGRFLILDGRLPIEALTQRLFASLKERRVADFRV